MVKEFEILEDGRAIDTRLGEYLKKCPSGGGSGACPYWVYLVDADAYYCYEDQYNECMKDEEVEG